MVARALQPERARELAAVAVTRYPSSPNTRYGAPATVDPLPCSAIFEVRTGVRMG